MLHEALDRHHTAALVIMEPRRHLLLEVEAQRFLRFADHEMQMAADGPKEIAAAPVQPVFRGRIDAFLDEILAGQIGMEIFGNPVERVQIAQAAFAILDVRLNAIARGAGSIMPLIAFGKLCRDELPATAGEHLVAEQPARISAIAVHRRESSAHRAGW